MAGEDIVELLRSHAAELRGRGISGLAIFGSAARGEARAESDVDLLIDLDPDSDFSLVDLVDLSDYLGDLLGRRADLVFRSKLRSRMREEILREAIQVY